MLPLRLPRAAGAICLCVALLWGGAIRGEGARRPPEKAFTPALVAIFSSIEEMLPARVPPEAAWVGATLRTAREDGALHTSGWVLERTDEYALLLNPDGKLVLATTGLALPPRAPAHDLLFAGCDLAPRQLSDEVSALEALRRGERVEANEWGKSGIFSDRSITVPEALIALWSYRRADKKLAASILFPRLEQLGGERHLRSAMQESLGTSHHLAMVDFFYNRDYANALRLARVLARPVFVGFAYQARARELAADLPKRMDDFKGFALPSPDEWPKIKARLDRPGQIRFLVDRLRLLNCVQHGTFGGIDYLDPQYATVAEREKNQDNVKSPQPTAINPVIELRRLALSPQEAMLLLPYMEDRRYIPSFEWGRFAVFQRREVARVSEVAGFLFGRAMRNDWLETYGYHELGAASRQKYLKKVRAWLQPIRHLSARDFLLQTLRTGPADSNLQEQLHDAIRWDLPAALPLVARRLEESHWQWDGEETGRALLELPSPELLAIARRGVERKVENEQWWGARALLRFGDPAEQQQAVAILGARLREEPGGLRNVFDDLMVSREPSAHPMALEIFSLHRNPVAEQPEIAAALFLRGDDEVLQLILKYLDSGFPEDGETAALLLKWRGDATALEDVPMEQRPALRKELRAWITEQSKLVQSGQKSAVPAPEPMEFLFWRHRL